MTETGSPVPVRVFTAPDVSCGAGMTWAAAVGFIGGRLRQRFEGRLAVEHIELFSQRSFEFPAVLAAVERGGGLPMVMVADRIVSQGGKLSESRIARAVESLSRTVREEGRT
jgi:hypothetical protein